MTVERRFILEQKRAPGDIVAMTALIRDIRLCHGDRYDIDARVSWPDILQHNPYLRSVHSQRGGEIISLHEHKPGIARAGRGEKLHFTRYFHDLFTQQTGIPLTMQEAKPDLYISEHERLNPPISGRYWLVFAGGKSDITIKHWRYEYYQQVVDQLRDCGLRFVQTGGTRQGHVHPPLKNVLNIVGWGGLRDLLWQIYHCEGVICPVTCAMHVAAAFNKPCVVIAGGREEPWWEEYSSNWPGAFGPVAKPISMPHKFLHTLGQLTCCAEKGCWKHKVVQIDHDTTLCHQPLISKGRQPLAACMEAISPKMVCDAVLDYYHQGLLPPPVAPDVPPRFTIHGELVPPEPISPSMNLLPQLPTSPPPPPVANIAKRSDLIDHPEIGGKFTVCALLYGDYPQLHRKCLDSILTTVPEDRRDLRIACHNVCHQTLDYLQSIPMTKLYNKEANDGKYVTMRQMFWDPECPLTTRYLIWFDDDTCAVNRGWLRVLCETILRNYQHGCGLYGDVRMHKLTPGPSGRDPREWIRAADWFRGRDFMTRQSKDAPNGEWIKFVVGWHWAIKVEALKAANVPDARLYHNGGDCLMGEQMHQAAYKVKEYNTQKSLIWCPTRENGGRRGYSEVFPWAK